MMDPQLLLFPATVVTFLILLIPQRRMQWPIWLRGVWSIGLFILLSYLMRLLLGSPLHAEFDSTQPGIEFWEKLVEAGWWLLGARGAIGFMRLIVVLEKRPPETQIISDLAAAAVYVATALAIVNFVFAVPIGGLLATSGIIAIVLGLALQSTLADVFSGIAVGLERPYRAGDLIWVEGGIEGQVTQVTWRSTHIATVQNNIAIVPNNVIAKARLVNRSRPTPIRGDTLELRLDPAIPPERCVDALTAAVRSCASVLSEPAPDVASTGLNGDGCIYQISFSVASSSWLSDAKHELLTEIHRQLRFAGIALGIAGSSTVVGAGVPTPADLLQQSDLFGVIEQTQRELLAAHFETISLHEGETLIKEGAEPDALYLMAAGVAEVTVAASSDQREAHPDASHWGGTQEPRVVHLLRPGESLGAVGLITGSPYAATARALTPVKAYRLHKDAIAQAIKIQPALAHGLEVLALRGQAALRRDAAAHEEDKREKSEMFLSKLQSLIGLLQSRN